MRCPLCFICKMRSGFVSNFPKFGLYTCEWCYLKKIHGAKRIVSILKNKLMFHTIIRKTMEYPCKGD